jgi:hypothetical protein
MRCFSSWKPKIKRLGSYNDKGKPFLGAFATLRKLTVRFVMSVCLRGTTLLPLDGFS